jgi:hypothetical protein
VKKAGELERAKRQADADIGMNMMNAYFKNRGGGPPATEAGTIPASSTESNAFATGGGAMPSYNLAGLSGDEPSFEMTPQGFKFGVKSASPLDSAIKVADVNLRQADQKLKGKEYDLKVEDQIVNKAKAADQFDTSHFNKINEVHKQEYDLKKQIDALKKDKAEGNISPQDYLASSNSILADLKALGAQKQALLAGRSTAQDTLGMARDEYRNPSSTEQQAIVPKTGASLTKPAPITPDEQGVSRGTMPLAKGPAIGAGLPYKKQVEAQQKKLEGDITQTRNILDASHAAAMASQQSKPATDRIMELLTKNNIGSRALKLRGGETAATIFSGNYDELNKWRNSLILQEKSEGESQLYNTLPELKIHSASLPSIDNDENTNRRAIVPVKNLMEARMVAPQFLETWAKQHGGTLDGARQEFRSWMQHNPMYQTHEKNGEVGIHENTHFIPLDIWTRLRQRFSEKDILKKRDSGGIQVLNGRVFFKE